MLVPSMDPDLVLSIYPNYISNTYIYMNNQSKGIPTQQVDNKISGCYGMYKKYYVQMLKTSSEYYHNKLVVDRDSF